MHIQCCRPATDRDSRLARTSLLARSASERRRLAVAYARVPGRHHTLGLSQGQPEPVNGHRTYRTNVLNTIEHQRTDGMENPTTSRISLICFFNDLTLNNLDILNYDPTTYKILQCNHRCRHLEVHLDYVSPPDMNVQFKWGVY